MFHLNFGDNNFLPKENNYIPVYLIWTKILNIICKTAPKPNSTSKGYTYLREKAYLRKAMGPFPNVPLSLPSVAQDKRQYLQSDAGILKEF